MKIRTGAITWCARCSITAGVGRQLCRYLATPRRPLKLKPGDVLPVEKPDRIIAHVDGVPVLTSQYGTLNGKYALRIEHLINPILNSLNEEQPK
ncbi:FliM/FliN family flagellar motor switch protein [Escherichia coli]